MRAWFGGRQKGRGEEQGKGRRLFSSFFVYSAQGCHEFLLIGHTFN